MLFLVLLVNDMLAFLFGFSALPPFRGAATPALECLWMGLPNRYQAIKMRRLGTTFGERILAAAECSCMNYRHVPRLTVTGLTYFHFECDVKPPIYIDAHTGAVESRRIRHTLPVKEDCRPKGLCGHGTICFTICLCVSPDLDGHRAPQMKDCPRRDP